MVIEVYMYIYGYRSEFFVALETQTLLWYSRLVFFFFLRLFFYLVNFGGIYRVCKELKSSSVSVGIDALLSWIYSVFAEIG